MPDPALVGIHHVKFPVTDLTRSRAWYERVFGLRLIMEFADEHDGVVRGVAYEIPGVPDLMIALRENPAAARGISGFDPTNRPHTGRFATAAPDRNGDPAEASAPAATEIPHADREHAARK